MGQTTDQNILFLSLNKLGDALIQTQLYSGLKAQNPSTGIHVLASEFARDILATNPHLNSLKLVGEPLTRKSFFSIFLIARKLVKNHNIDMVVLDQMNSNPLSWLLVRMLSVKRVVASASRVKFPILVPRL